jgi:hypothetical protein
MTLIPVEEGPSSRSPKHVLPRPLIAADAPRFPAGPERDSDPHSHEPEKPHGCAPGRQGTDHRRAGMVCTLGSGTLLTRGSGFVLTGFWVLACFKPQWPNLILAVA